MAFLRDDCKRICQRCPGTVECRLFAFFMKTRHLIPALLALLFVACTNSPDSPPVKDVPPPSTPRGATTSTQPRTTPPLRPNQERSDRAAGTTTATTGQGATPPPFVPSAPGKRVARVSVPGNYVALTFDDGPSASLTPRVLDILKEYGASATFFVLGENAARNKSILARAASEGHEIASHTWGHVKLTGCSQEKICSEMERTSAVIAEATGRRPSLMRPPYGATNSSIVNLMADRFGMTSVLWDVDTRDWQHPGVDVVVRRAVGGARPGSIILVHDIHASTLAAVEGIVSGLQARGFRLVTVSQLIALGRRAAEEASSSAPSSASSSLPVAAEASPSSASSAGAPQSASRPVGTLVGGTGSSSIGTLPPAPPTQQQEETSGAWPVSEPISE